MHIHLPTNVCPPFCGLQIFFICPRLFSPIYWILSLILLFQRHMEGQCQSSYHLTFCTKKRSTVGWNQRTDFGGVGVNLQFGCWLFSSVKSRGRASEDVSSLFHLTLKSIKIGVMGTYSRNYLHGIVQNEKK